MPYDGYSRDVRVPHDDNHFSADRPLKFRRSSSSIFYRSHVTNDSNDNNAIAVAIGHCPFHPNLYGIVIFVGHIVNSIPSKKLFISSYTEFL